MKKNFDSIDRSFEDFNREEKIKNQIFEIWCFLEYKEQTEMTFLNNLLYAVSELLDVTRNGLSDEKWEGLVLGLSEETAHTLIMVQEIRRSILKNSEDEV